MRRAAPPLLLLLLLAAAAGLRSPKPQRRNAGETPAERHLSQVYAAGELVTKEKEQTLARQVRDAVRLRGDMERLAEQLRRTPSLEEIGGHCGVAPGEVHNILREGALAKRTLLRANMRMVLKLVFAETRHRPFACVNYEREDLLHEGMLHLSRAVSLSLKPNP